MTAGGARYAVQVQGHLDAHWANWLGELTITHNDDGTSTLIGVITDQAALHGLLAKLRDLGITLIAVTPAAQPARTTDAGRHRSPAPQRHSPIAGQQSPHTSPETE